MWRSASIVFMIRRLFRVVVFALVNVGEPLVRLGKVGTLRQANLQRFNRPSQIPHAVQRNPQ